MYVAPHRVVVSCLCIVYVQMLMKKSPSEEDQDAYEAVRIRTRTSICSITTIGHFELITNTAIRQEGWSLIICMAAHAGPDTCMWHSGSCKLGVCRHFCPCAVTRTWGHMPTLGFYFTQINGVKNEQMPHLIPHSFSHNHITSSGQCTHVYYTVSFIGSYNKVVVIQSGLSAIILYEMI